MLLERRDNGHYRAAGTLAAERVKGATMIVGYGSVFFDPRDPGTEYQLTSTVKERIAPHAFDKSLASSDDVIACFDHKTTWLLGRRSKGTLRLFKDAKGLRYEIDYNDADPQHVTVMAKLRRGDLDGSSFQFVPTKETRTPTSTGYIRTIEALTLFEVGPVAWPAYTAATAGARGDEPTAPRSNATPGSVRWCHENPHSREAVDARLHELRQERLRHIEREMVLDRLAMISNP